MAVFGDAVAADHPEKAQIVHFGDTVTLAVGSAKNQMVMARWAIRSVEDAPVENDAEPQV